MEVPNGSIVFEPGDAEYNFLAERARIKALALAETPEYLRKVCRAFGRKYPANISKRVMVDFIIARRFGF